MAALLRLILVALTRIWTLIKAFLPDALSWGLARATQAAVYTGIQVGVLFAWGTFLGAVYTGFFAMGLRAIFNSNPLAGAPAGTVGLLDSCFPVQFAFGLYAAYITWGFTCIPLAMVMSRAIKFLPGA